MRHLKRGRKLNRTASHRKAMVRNLVSSLFTHGRVVTTPAKAKEARPFAEKLITLAKNDSLHARRRAVSLLHNYSVVSSLFTEIAPRYAQRPGGYCRILHLAKTRIGDSAPQAIFELVESEMPEKKKAAAPAKVEEKAEPKAEVKEEAKAEAPEAEASEEAAGEEASEE
ncbi:MAG: 50S ribosomal protein L17 [Planctomycetes bacterium]|nr:50S ribosomal protein L17 [Planctomycetota bacterium]